MKSIDHILRLLKESFLAVDFIVGDDFVWSSKNKTVTYKHSNTQEHIWALVHETAHASLGHKIYQSDQHLLSMELEAWQEAKKIAQNLNISINQDHIEECLDTYRDWLHARSACPECAVVGTQNSNRYYKCFNCQCVWSVPDSPLCKITKRKVKSLVG